MPRFLKNDSLNSFGLIGFLSFHNPIPTFFAVSSIPLYIGLLSFGSYHAAPIASKNVLTLELVPLFGSNVLV